MMTHESSLDSHDFSSSRSTDDEYPRSSTSSTSPLSADAPSPHPAPHPSPASQASQANFELDHEAIASRATNLVELLSDENSALRHELETYHQKVAKLQKFEHEIYKVQTEHERLIESTQKREHLEKLVRTKLEVEVKKLQERNRDLSVHVESHCRGGARSGKDEDSGEGDLHAEISQKENTIFQFQMKCKDLDETNMQLMNELTEQRQHVDMLDAALSKAQADVARLQEECAQRQIYVDKVGSLQRLVTSLQAAHQKREKLETRLRHKLEKEINKLRGHESAANQDEGVSELEDGSQPEGALAGMLSEKEHTILKLEAEVSKWEHKYLEECAIRQCHVDLPQTNRLEAGGDPEVQKEEGQAEEDMRHKVKIQDMEGRLAALSIEVQKRDMIIQALQNQFLERGHFTSSSSTERHIMNPAPGMNPQGMSHQGMPPQGISPHQSYQSLRRGSVDSSLQGNLSGPSPAGSSNSLHNIATRSPGNSIQNLYGGQQPQQQQQQSPVSSTQSLHNCPPTPPVSSTQSLYMSPVSSNQNLTLVSRSPATSQSNLTHVALGGRSPAGSQQSLGVSQRPLSHGSLGSGLGSQERLMGFSDSCTSLSTSGQSTTGTDGGSEADLARETSALDERLKQLDIEIAQQDRILGSIWKT